MHHLCISNILDYTLTIVSVLEESNTKLIQQEMSEISKHGVLWLNVKDINGF